MNSSKRTLIAMAWLLACVVIAPISVYADDAGIVETVTTTEEAAEETTETLESQGEFNTRVIQRVTGGLGDYWQDSADRLSGGRDNENGFGFRLLMSVSNICQKTYVVLAPLAFVIGIFLQVIAGMKKTLRRTGVVVMIGIPIALAVMAYGVPIAASNFFYGR